MSENSSAKKSLLDRILDAIERAGNKLPDPITMFLGLAIIVTIISAICTCSRRLRGKPGGWINDRGI